MNLNIRDFFFKGDIRTLSIKRNIAGSFLLKCISIIISLQVVPLTINYVNSSQYGIWLTLSSIILWLNYFDLGFAHGFRNRFAEARAMNNIKLAKEYVSTTYAVLFLLFTSIFFIVFVLNHFLNWCNILNIADCENSELQIVVALLACFFCINIIASVFTTMLSADQKPALTSLVNTSGQLLAFIGIYIMTKTIDGSLIVLVFALSGIPCLWLIIVSLCVFHGKNYKALAPSLKYIRFSLTKNILGLGGQFFVIMISMLLIFQFINIIISRVEGTVAVTQYNVAYKYFNVLNMVAVIILTPFWSAFTNAYTQKDFAWMKRMVKKLEMLWLICIPVILIMILCSNVFFDFWLGDSVYIPFSLSIGIGLYVLFQTAGNLYMYMINGTGKVRLQMIIYIAFGIISVPLSYLFCIRIGIEGVLIIPTLSSLVQAFVGRLQITKLISNTATGLFDK